MSSNKVFGEDTKGCADQLFKMEIKNAINKKAVVSLYEKEISFADIQQKVRQQPFLSSTKKSSILQLDNFDWAGAQKVNEAFAALPKSKETAVIEYVQIEKFPQVKCLHAEMKTNEKTGETKMCNPRLLISLKGHHLEAYHGYRINTGVVVKIPSMVVGKTVIDQQIVDRKINGRPVIAPQPDFVIIPQILSPHPGLIQQLYARDAEDTGLLTINFTTTQEFKNNLVLQIGLTAFTCVRPVSTANIIDGEGGVLFKNKDNRSGRSVKNTKTKFYADQFDLTTSPGSLLLKTFDNSGATPVDFKDQKIKLDHVVTFFSSRKREWANPRLVTYAGVYNPNNLNATAPGIIVKGSEILNNAHCASFLNTKLVLFSKNAPFSEDIRLINGAFSNLNNYPLVVKKMRQVVTASQSLSIGAKNCEAMAKRHPELNALDLLRVYDYNHSLPEYGPRLTAKLNATDEQLFEERPNNTLPYSAQIKKAIQSLASMCLQELFTKEQLKEMSLKNNESVEEGVNGEKKLPNEAGENSIDSVDSLSVEQQPLPSTSEPLKDEVDTPDASTKEATIAATIDTTDAAVAKEPEAEVAIEATARNINSQTTEENSSNSSDLSQVSAINTQQVMAVDSEPAVAALRKRRSSDGIDSSDEKRIKSDE